MTEGFILFNYQGKEYQTWCELVSNLDSRARTLGHGAWRVKSVLCSPCQSICIADSRPSAM